MNTEPERLESQSQSPEKITRRTFVKRTTATAVATALALQAFRSELRADTLVFGSISIESGGSTSGYWVVEMTSTPASLVLGIDPQTKILNPPIIPTSIVVPAWTSAMSMLDRLSGMGALTLPLPGGGVAASVTFTLVKPPSTINAMIDLQAVCTPNTFTQQPAPTPVWKYLNSGEEITFNATFRAASGGTALFNQTASVPASFSVDLLNGGPMLSITASPPNPGLPEPVSATDNFTSTALLTMTISIPSLAFVAPSPPMVVTFTHHVRCELNAFAGGTTVLNTNFGDPITGSASTSAMGTAKMFVTSTDYSIAIPPAVFLPLGFSLSYFEIIDMVVAALPASPPPPAPALMAVVSNPVAFGYSSFWWPE
jgi:hypothetical protein